MELSLRTWTNNQNSVSVDYGPLTFALKIGERYERQDSTKTAIGDSSWQKDADPSQWPSYEIHPTTAWNYGLVPPGPDLAAAFQLTRRPWPTNNFPFTLETVPLQLTARARKIPAWSLDRHGLCAVLQPSPAFSPEPVETLELVPMGAARLRIAAFPTVTEDAQKGSHWQAAPAPKPAKYKTTASHCFGSDSVEAVADGLLPASSDDEAVPRLTFWPHQGTREWVQFDFGAAKTISQTGVYWFDDTGHGQCRAPQSARLLYRTGAGWEVVPGADLATKRDVMNRVNFPAITTTALRLEIQLETKFSAGVLEWEVP